jgi:hypothetical protein
MPSKPPKHSPPPQRRRPPEDGHGEPEPHGDRPDADRDRPERDEPAPRDRDRDRDWQRLIDASGDVEWSPWLLIRYAIGDLGVRSIPASAAFYLAPDISVEIQGALGPVARAGERNFLHATVFNFGSSPSVPTKVDFYWADPSLGMGPGNMNWIGTEWVEIKSIFQGGGALDVRCNSFWVPDVVNGGHECVQVHCSNPLFDPIEQPFLPRVDRHVGQRNLTVLHGPAGKTLAFAVKINNPWHWVGRTSIKARVERITVAAHATTRRDSLELVNALAAFGEPAANDATEIRERFQPDTAEFASAQHVADLMSARERSEHAPVLARSSGAAASISAQLTVRSLILQAVHPNRLLGSQLLASDALSPAGQRAADFPLLLLEGIQLKPLEQRELILELGVPRDARPDEYLVFHLAQFADELQVGGYAIVVTVE